MVHWRHDYQFWRTFYTNKTSIRIYLCDGDDCDHTKTSVTSNTDDYKDRIPLEDVNAEMDKKLKLMLENKKKWKHIEALRETWKDYGKELNNKTEHTYCTSCGSTQVTATN